MRSGAPERTSRPFVAVIVPVYDDAERLTRCLRALEEQTYPADQYQVLVVDNGSSEDIAGVCRAFPRVRCLLEPRPGSYAARNKGIASTDGELLAFTDSDCLPHRDWLERGAAHLQAEPDLGMVGGNVLVFPKDPSRKTAVELYESAFAFPQRQRIEAEHWSVTANLLVRRDVMEAVGPFDAELRSGGDAEWCRRAHAAGHRLAYAEDARVDHPARASLAELRAKARRVAGGARAARHDVPKRYLARFLVRSAYHSLRKTLWVLAGDRFNATDVERFTVLERLKISTVINLVTVWRLTEVVSLRFTERTARRS